MFEKAMSFEKRDLEPPTRFNAVGAASPSLCKQKGEH